MANFEDIILRFSAEDEEGKSALEEFAALLSAVGGIDAEPEVDLKGVTTAEADLGQLFAILKAMDALNVQPDIKPNIDVTGVVPAEQRVGEIASLLELLGAMEADPNIDVHGAAAAVGEIGLVATALQGLEHKNVDIELVVKRGRLGELNGILSSVRAGFGGVQEAATGLGSTLTRVGVNFGAFSARLGPAIIGVITVLGAVVISLVGGLFALATSAILAAGAVAAIAVALAAVLGPGLLLAIALGSRLTAVFQALAARQAAKLQKQQQAVQGNQQEEQSMRAIADAAEALDRAQANLRDATLAANREMADSYEKVRDAVRALQHAELDREEAKLGIERAQLELEKFRNELGLAGDDIAKMFKKFTDVSIDFNPTQVTGLLNSTSADPEDRLHLKELILAVREAKLREKDATNGLSDAERDLTRAQQDNLEFRQKGIRASNQYVSALQAVADAQKSLARAQEDKGAISAQAKGVVLTKQLTKQERIVLGLLEKIRTAFKRAFAGAIDPIWDAFIGILRQVPGLLQGIAPGMKILGTAVGAMIKALGGKILNPANIRAFNLFALAGARLTGPVARALGSLFDLFVAVAKAALPALVDLAGQFADKLQEWADWATTGDNLQGVIDTMVENLKIWLQIAGELGRVFIGFLTAANGPGQQLASHLRDALKHLADLLGTKKGRKEFTDFFQDGARNLESVARSLVDIVTTLGTLSDLAAVIITPFQVFFDVLARGATNIKNGYKIAVEAVRAMLKGIEVRFSGLPAKFLGILEDIFLKIVGFIPHMLELGKNLAQGLFDGMKSILKPSKVKDLLLGPLLTLPNKLFKIGSPSKVWADMGKNLVAGLEQGLNQKTSSLGATVEQTLKVPAVTAPHRTIKTAAAAGASAGVGSQENHFNITVPGGNAPDPDAFVNSVERRLRRIR